MLKYLLLTVCIHKIFTGAGAGVATPSHWLLVKGRDLSFINPIALH
jgi:hypothetical protein